MFSLSKNRTFKTKVPIPIPGQPKDGVIEFEFIFMDRDWIKDFIATLPDRDDETSLQEIVCGWNGVDVEFSTESFTRLLRSFPGSARTILDKFLSEVTQAKTKN